MRSCCGTIVAAALVVMATACGRAPAPRQYEVRGQILSVDSERQQVLVNHEDIPGFMPAMTMPYKVQNPALLDGKQPGDLFSATLVVEDTDAYLTMLTTTGHATLDVPPAGPTITADDLLEKGELVPDTPLVDQTGAARALTSLRGHRVALTFIYTRCPLPDFCPLMDKHFLALQEEIARSPELGDVRLVSVTVDPAFDAPAVLAAHARRLGAHPDRWLFLTGPPEDVRAFARQFGVIWDQGETPDLVVHNLRTAVIDADGRIVTIHSGNTWTPADLVADLEATQAPATAAR